MKRSTLKFAAIAVCAFLAACATNAQTAMAANLSVERFIRSSRLFSAAYTMGVEGQTPPAASRLSDACVSCESALSTLSVYRLNTLEIENVEQAFRPDPPELCRRCRRRARFARFRAGHRPRCGRVPRRIERSRSQECIELP